MKQGDKQFLAKLAKELNTENSEDWIENPIWCIMEKAIVIEPEGYGDFKIVVGSGRVITLKDFADEISEQASPALKQEANKALRRCACTDDLRRALETYSGENPYDYRVYDASKQDYICRDSTGFLTKKSANKHLKLNALHYSKDARVQVLSVWGNPVYKRLINIIKNTNWEEL